MIIKIIKFMFVIVTSAFLIELIFKSKFFSALRMHFILWKIEIETKCVMFMKKYKFLYRVMIEMFIIWFVFEWNNKLIISYIVDLYLLVSKKMEPLSTAVKEIFIFLSPYGRNIMKNEIVFDWMKIFSIGLLIVLIILIIVMLLEPKRLLYKIFIICIITFIDWYALLLSAFVISKIPQEHSFICWALAIFFFILIQITLIGIFSEDLFD